MRVNAVGPKNAKIAFVGMAPATDELRTGAPFTGAAGQILNTALNKLGLSRHDVWIGNIHDGFLAPGSSLYSLPHNELDESIRRLRQELMKLSPNVVVPLGDEPLYFICGLTGITKWRGSILSSDSDFIEGLKCVPSVHPAWITRGMWKWEPVFTYVDLKRAIDESLTKEIKLPERHAITGPSLHTIFDYIEECKKHERLSLDIEVLWHLKNSPGEIACIGIGYSINEALCIPLTHADGTPFWSIWDEIRIWLALATLLQSGIPIIGQNLSFEWIHFWLHKIYPANMWIDTMLLHHTLYPDFGGTEDIWGKKRADDVPGHSLAFINSQYTCTPYYKDDGRLWTPRLGEHQFWEYNCKDVMVTADAALQMMNEAIEQGLWQFYLEFQRDSFMHFCRTEWFGVAIDTERRSKVGEDLNREIKEIQDKINQKLGYQLNVRSPKQMQALLYDRMGLKVRKHRKTGRPTVGKDILQMYAEKTQDEVLLWIQDLKKAVDLKSDIIDQPLGTDGRMHTHYKMGGTDSNRRSSAKSVLGTGTNLQNIPRDGPARSIFIPRRAGE